MSLRDYVGEVREKVGRWQTGRAQRKLDRRLDRYMNKAHLGRDERSAEFEDDWLTHAPRSRDVEENVEGARRVVQEMAEDMRERGYDVSESEVAYKLVDDFASESESDISWAKGTSHQLEQGSVVELTYEQAQSRLEDGRSYAKMAERLAEEYDMTERGGSRRTRIRLR